MQELVQKGLQDLQAMKVRLRLGSLCWSCCLLAVSLMDDRC